MSDKKLIMALGAVLIVIAIVILIALNSRESSRPRSITEVGYYDEETDKKIEDIETGKITGKYESLSYNYAYISLTQEDRNNIDKVIDYVYELINTKNVDTMYEHIDEDYRYVVFRKKEDLKEYLNKNYDSNIAVTSFDIIDGKLSINFITGESAKGKSIIVNNYESGNVEDIIIEFDGFTSLEKVNFTFIANDADIRCEYLLKYASYSTLLLEIENTSKKEMSLDFNGTSLVAKKGRNYLYFDAVPNSKLTIPAGKTIRYELNVGSVSKTPDTIEIVVNINGKKYEDELILTYRDFEGDE